MIKKIEGIVVSEIDYKESSKILNILTPDMGMIGVIARGAKRMKSRVKAGKLTYGIFEIVYHENGLSVLTDVSVINSYYNIFSNYKKICYVMVVLELSYYVYMESKDKNIYNYLKPALEKINDGLDARTIKLIVEFKYLEVLGIKPIIDRCVTCGSKNVITLSSYKGGYLCKDCLDNEPVVLTKTMKFANYFYYIDLANITKCDLEEKVIKQLELFIDDYYDRYSGLYIKSKIVLNELI